MAIQFLAGVGLSAGIGIFAGEFCKRQFSSKIFELFKEKFTPFLMTGEGCFKPKLTLTLEQKNDVRKILPFSLLVDQVNCPHSNNTHTDTDLDHCKKKFQEEYTKTIEEYNKTLDIANGNTAIIVAISAIALSILAPNMLLRVESSIPMEIVVNTSYVLSSLGSGFFWIRYSNNHFMNAISQCVKKV